MNKEAFLQETYDSAFNDELNCLVKTAKLTAEQQAEIKRVFRDREIEYERGINSADEEYDKSMEPFSKYKKIDALSGILSAIAGGVAGAKIPGGAGRKALLGVGGALAGGIGGYGVSDAILRTANPEYKRIKRDAFDTSDFKTRMTEAKYGPMYYENDFDYEY